MISAHGIYISSKTCVIVFLGWHFEIVRIILTFRERLVCSMRYGVYVFYVKYFNFVRERCSGELRMQKLKSHPQSLKVLSLKPGGGQYIATHATLTARDFFLVNYFPSGPFT